MKNIYTVYGCGGFAREVMPLLRDHVSKSSQNIKNEFYFIDDLQNKKTTTNGTKIFTFENIIEVFSQSKFIVVLQ